jgi:hypothetical protein
MDTFVNSATMPALVTMVIMLAFVAITLTIMVTVLPCYCGFHDYLR